MMIYIEYIIIILYIFMIHLHWYFLGLERQCRGQYQEVARMPTHNILCTGPCSKCTVCPLCALCSMSTLNYMCIPWTRKCVHRVANSFWHVAVCAESSSQLCIPEILENFQSRTSSAPERTCFFWLHWARNRMYVWVNGILHFDLMINISCLVNGHVLILVIIHKTSPFD